MDASPFLLIAAGATAICCFCALWALRLGPGSFFRKPSPLIKSPTKLCGCSCSCADEEVAADGEEMAAEVERQGAAAGSSMMEQLVPEITTHALSYLDYTSLCRLSMTNSAMRRAANDDGAWKALYHKDFTVEQDSINPSNGWKAYYASTKAIISLNAEFYNIIRERYNAVMDSWFLAFNWGQGGGQGLAFHIRDVRARVLSEMAWVTMKAYVDVDSGPFHVTNVYEFHNGRWYMVHHHSSVILMNGDPGMLNFFG
ncbi:F-box protein SKIP8-like isoform X4 [Typha angustifolia]|uniref:F-box protein SKIP8-like isoform X4 n=1 Tax=Typha angustifolia TaxID=59011 RepID=UPI003C2BC43E